MPIPTPTAIYVLAPTFLLTPTPIPIRVLDLSPNRNHYLIHHPKHDYNHAPQSAV